MPPRKSNDAAAVVPGEGPTATNHASATKGQDGINIEDLSLPRTMVTKMAKAVLPPSTQIQKEAIIAIQKSATVFISYLANQANISTQDAGRKTIPPKAVVDALKELEFTEFVPRVEAELDAFTTLQTTKRTEYRKKVKEGQQQAELSGINNDGDVLENDDHGSFNGKVSDDAQVIKRPRVAEFKTGAVKAQSDENTIASNRTDAEAVHTRISGSQDENLDDNDRRDADHENDHIEDDDASQDDNDNDNDDNDQDRDPDQDMDDSGEDEAEDGGAEEDDLDAMDHPPSEEMDDVEGDRRKTSNHLYNRQDGPLLDENSDDSSEEEK